MIEKPAGLAERRNAYVGILDFWFLTPDHPGFGHYRAEWFRKDAAFDEIIRQRFTGQIEEALDGGLHDWEGTAEGSLARILLLDQFTRNLFRGTARSFSGDAEALALAQRLVGSGRDKDLSPIRRWFIFLPFEHSESLLNQEQSVALFAALRREAQQPAFDNALDYAERHRAVIERFGRFPHRNEILGRPSTVEEIDFLRQPGSTF